MAQSTSAARPAVTAASAPAGNRAMTGWLEQAGLGEARVAVDVRLVATGATLMTRNAADALNPASAIKLVTTAAALDELGPQYRWQTRFYLDGPLVDTRLAGDLRVVGGGDPKFVIEDLQAMIEQMRAAGLHHIDGDLLIDRSLYQPAVSAGAFDGRAAEPYNVEPDAALMNFKSTKFVVTPRADFVDIVLDPALAGVAIDNRVTLVDGRCQHGASGLAVSVVDDEAGPVIRVVGRYSKACGEGWAFHAVLDHTRFADAFFRAAWVAAGGSWSGRARSIPSGMTPVATHAPATPWYVWQSPRPLAQAVTDINKFSNNVMTRQLLLHLGAVRGQATAGAAEAAPATRFVANEAAGRRVVERWLQGRRIDARSLVLDNGAGLSREARASAALLVDVLMDAATHSHADIVRNSLPVVGEDGTMRRRLRGEPVAGNAWMKTGSIADVRSIAGYVRARSGQLVALAFIVNDRHAQQSIAVQDKLLQWVFDNG